MAECCTKNLKQVSPTKAKCKICGEEFAIFQ